MQCPKCAGSMTEGFVADATHGAIGVSSWVEGTPDKSVWTGVRLGNKRRAEIATWRCNRCGFLEHYAVQATDGTSAKAAQRGQAVLILALVAAGLLAVLAGVMVAR